ncbi:flagellin [Cupriavidus necator]|uniref:Flagellin n=1 Tax=Cupriavidus necator TaxID=106590 RepID=A0A1U9V2Q6_CUPNE|nr:flagellin [Cupriavidus necator]AQV98917.1 flagellin [Cupriavidus necator]
MAQVINTNSLSLMTQNNLTASQSSLNTAIQRLSSGLRINSAKDDAAGLAIANRFTANINGLTQAQRNANDGISMAQTTEGALTEVTNNLQRIRQLSVQSANGSNSASDLQSIQDEITQRMAEIDRISGQTDFNGVKVLSSAAKPLNIQVGASDGQTIAVNLQEISTKTLGMASFNVNQTGTANTAATSKDLLAAGYAAGAVTNGTTVYTKAYGAADQAKVADVLSHAQYNATTPANSTTVVDAGQASIAKYTYTGSDYTFTDTARAVGTVASDLKPAAGGQTQITYTNKGGTTVNATIDSNGMLTSTAGGKALYLDTTGNLTENNTGGTLAQANINGSGAVATGDIIKSLGTNGGSIVVGSAANAPTYTYTAGTATANATNLHISAAALQTQVQASSAANIITVNLDGAAATQVYNVAVGGTVSNGGNTTYLDMNGALDSNAAGKATLYVQSNGAVTDGAANTVYADSAKAGKFTLNGRSGNTSTANPLSVVDNALSIVDKLRSSLGAIQNRLDSTIANLGTTITNLSSSRSRIQDADYATEVSNMTRANILQQAGTSVLAQANQSTQGVLSLLR